MDRWDKMKKCDCGCIDTSPQVREPYCLIYAEDFDCDNCVATDEQKTDACSLWDSYNG